MHCTRGSALCGPGSGAVADRLPDEPGGYLGYRALYGNRFVQPAISPAGPVRDLSGKVITDGSGNVGFPGYNGMIGTNALAYTLDMQLHGIPVTYTYLSDLHESWVTGNPFGPGEAGYERQLHAEDAAFGVFFHRLAAHGITTANTLFVITADEGDHFVGGPPSPSDCNGVSTPCRYRRIGEVDANLNGLLASQAGLSTGLDVGADSAPAVYVHGQPPRAAPRVRALERATARLVATDLATGRPVRLTRYLADPVEMRILHLITGDPRRTPSYVGFANPDFWVQGGPASCRPATPCVTEDPTEAWNHGTIASEITTTWLGLVGPGVRRGGYDNALWSDHTDIQPTMLALLGLRDDYAPDGRVLLEALDPAALPPAMRAHQPTLRRLGEVYTQLQACVGAFGQATLRASTRALASGSSGDDHTYRSLETQLQRLGSARDKLAIRIRGQLLGAAFDSQPIDEPTAIRLIKAGEQLLGQAQLLGQ